MSAILIRAKGDRFLVTNGEQSKDATTLQEALDAARDLLLGELGDGPLFEGAAHEGDAPSSSSGAGEEWLQKGLRFLESLS